MEQETVRVGRAKHFRRFAACGRDAGRSDHDVLRIDPMHAAGGRESRENGRHIAARDAIRRRSAYVIEGEAVAAADGRAVPVDYSARRRLIDGKRPARSHDRAALRHEMSTVRQRSRIGRPRDRIKRRQRDRHQCGRASKTAPVVVSHSLPASVRFEKDR